jgi:hypothetical protein
MEPRERKRLLGSDFGGKKGRQGGVAATDSGEKHLCSCIRQSESLVESNEEARQCNRPWWKMIAYFYLPITRNAWYALSMIT